MIEFRWVVLLTLWTLLIGPVVDLAQHNSRAQHAHSKPAHVAKVRTAK
jgi:hypothetical protein